MMFPVEYLRQSTTTVMTVCLNQGDDDHFEASQLDKHFNINDQIVELATSVRLAGRAGVRAGAQRQRLLTFKGPMVRCLQN